MKKIFTLILVIGSFFFGPVAAHASQGDDSLGDSSAPKFEQLACEAAFANLSYDIEVTYPQQWLGSEVEANVQCRFRVSITSAPSSEFSSKISSSGLDIEVVVSPGWNSQRIDAFVEHTYEILSTTEGYENVSLSTDYLARTITVDGVPGIANVANSFTDNLPAESGLSFQLIDSVQTDSSQRQILTAGGTVPLTNGTCSSGFVVGNSAGYGISTADHCAGAVFYNGGTYYVISEVGLAKAEGDVRVLFLGGANGALAVTDTAPYFLSNVNTLTAVAAVVNPVVGQSVCFYGLASGKKCSTVYSLSTTGNGYSKLASMATLVSQAGDSGGAVYAYKGSGTATASAIGLISGQAPIAGVIRTQFTRISAINLLNVHISTTATP